MSLIKRDGNVIGGGIPAKHRICVVCLQEPEGPMSYGLAFEDGERRLARRFCGPCVKAIQDGLTTRIVETKVLYQLLEDVRES